MGVHETGAVELAAGEVVGGRYRVERFLARGAHSEVYAAVDLSLNERIALKLLRGQALAEEQVALFKREAKLARQVSHPNVCRLHGYAEDGGRHFLTLELLEGETLAARLARGPLSSDEVAALARQLCAGLQAIHAVGVVHRDLKPPNIFVGARVVIADFGVARSVLEGGAASSALVGTPAYMAPEQLWGEAVSPATDVYALGLVLVECLTGKRPFEGETLQALSQRKLPALLGTPWDTVLQRCLAPRAVERFQSAHEVAAALPVPEGEAALLSTATPSSELPPTATPGARPNRGFRFSAGTLVSGRYRVLRQLARGGMGEVYEVEDTQLREAVALKLLDSTLASHALARERFQGEVKAARRVAHPNVCRIFDLGLHDDVSGSCLFLTMELLSGPTLEERLRAPLLREEALPIVEQVASALDAAHAVGVVHRDLKPSNIMLARFPGGGVRAVVTDFGIARRLDEAPITRDGWVGTPAYIAPEQLEGRPVGPAADLYSLGVILFELATGRLPFTGNTALEVAVQRLAVPAPLARSVAPDVSPQWESAIARCLQREPSARWPSASAAVSALSGGTPRDSQDPPRERGARPPASPPDDGVVPRSRRARRAALAFAGALALAGAGFTLVSRQPRLPPPDKVLSVDAVGEPRLPPPDKVLSVDAVGEPRLPPSDRVLSVEVVGEPDTTPGRDDVLPPFDDAAAWVVRRSWRELETNRRFRIAAESTGNVVARLRWRRAPSGITARLEVGVPGNLLSVGAEVKVGSILAAAEALYPTLAARVGDGQAALPLSPEEAERAAQACAPTPEAYLAYARIFDGYTARAQIDAPRALERTRKLVAQFPGWGLPSLLLCLMEGLSSEPCRRAQATAAASSQPADIADLLSAVTLVREGRNREAALLKTLQAPIGPVGELRSLMASYLGGDPSEAYAWLGIQRPDLQFRTVSLSKQASSGRSSEAREALRAWLSVAPGQEQAWILAARLAVPAGAAAARTVEELRRLQGSDPDILLSAMDLELAQFHPEAALALAGNVEADTPYYAAHKHQRAGNAYLMMGQFGRARDQLMTAHALARSVGADLSWAQSSRDLIRINEMLGEQEAAATWRTVHLKDLRHFGWPPEVAVGLTYDGLAARQRCPSTKGLLLHVRDEATRRKAERVLARRALRKGCGDCERVLALESADFEPFLDSVTLLASCLQGAQRTSAGLRLLEPYLRYFEQSLDFNVPISVPEVVRAQYWHGRLLQQSGDLSGARAAYSRFVELWGNADAPIAEMPDARVRLEALRP